MIRNRIIEKGDNEWKGNKPIIMITGDVVNDGAENQYKDAKDYLDELHGAGFNLRLIPGNHDYGKITVENEIFEKNQVSEKGV